MTYLISLDINSCSRPKKVQKKTFVIAKTLPEITISLPEVTATVNIENFINTTHITNEGLISYKHQFEAPE